MDALAIPKFAQNTLQALRAIGVSLVTIWEQRELRRHATEVSNLFFGAGGMRQTLQHIADGQGNDGDLQALEQQLERTEPAVSSIITTLNKRWEKLIARPDGLEVANEIGNLIHCPLGKMGIRHAIGEVSRGEPRSPETIMQAQQLCRDIDSFNERLIKLHKRVLKPAAKVFRAGGR
jgi:hypothetical protein